jgi:hypothetical protein
MGGPDTIALGYAFGMAIDLTRLETTEDAGRALPSYGPSWDAAIAAGVDVTMIEANLCLTPGERLRRHDAYARFREQVQSRTVSPTLRAAIEARRVDEKLASLGLGREQVLAHISSGDGHG